MVKDGERSGFLYGLLPRPPVCMATTSVQAVCACSRGHQNCRKSSHWAVFASTTMTLDMCMYILCTCWSILLFASKEGMYFAYQFSLPTLLSMSHSPSLRPYVMAWIQRIQRIYDGGEDPTDT
jgi:hypothetical protein